MLEDARQWSGSVEQRYSALLSALEGKFRALDSGLSDPETGQGALLARLTRLENDHRELVNARGASNEATGATAAPPQPAGVSVHMLQGHLQGCMDAHDCLVAKVDGVASAAEQARAKSVATASTVTQLSTQLKSLESRVERVEAILKVLMGSA